MGMEKEKSLIKYFSRRSIGSVNPFEMGGKKRGNVYLWNISALYAQTLYQVFYICYAI